MALMTATTPQPQPEPAAVEAAIRAAAQRLNVRAYRVSDLLAAAEKGKRRRTARKAS